MQRVLLIDDDEWVREAVVSELAELDYEVSEAETLAQVRAYLAGGEVFAFVLLDLRIPGIDPERVLSEFLAAWPATPVLLFSGLDREAVPARMFGSGHVGFLPKPFENHELTHELARLGAST